MIVKKVRREIVDKPKTWQIGDLVDYIRFPHNKNPQEKVAHAGSRNFLTSTHNGQKMEMIALAEESVHSKMPVQHWIFFWITWGCPGIRPCTLCIMIPITTIFTLR